MTRDNIARAIWKVKPDCLGKTFPPDVWDDKARRAYPHNPIAALDLCWIYADAVIALGNNLPESGKEFPESAAVTSNDCGTDVLTEGK